MASVYNTVEFNSFENYFQNICKIPTLDIETENNLVTTYQKTQNQEIYKKIILSNLKFIVSIAKMYNGYGLPIADLVHSGSIGLMKSISNYDQKEGINFKSFAQYYIRYEIVEFVVNNYNVVKLATTKAKRKLFFKLKSMKNALIKEGREWLVPSEIKTISEKLNVKEVDVMEMEKGLYLPKYNLDVDSDSSDDDIPDRYSVISSNNTMEDEFIEEEEIENKKHIMMKAIESLNEKEKEILYKRILVESDEKMTFAELAEKYGVSCQRIDQIEKNMMKKLKTICLN